MTKGLNATLGPLVYASNQSPFEALAYQPAAGLVGYAKVEAKKAQPLAIRPDKITKSATVYAVFSLQ